MGLVFQTKFELPLLIEDVCYFMDCDWVSKEKSVICSGVTAVLWEN